MSDGLPTHDRTPELLNRLLLDRSQVAEALGTTVATIETLHRTGRLQGVKVGKALFWKPQWVREYVDGLQPDQN